MSRSRRTTPGGRRRRLVTAAACVAVLAGCSSHIAGTPVAALTPPLTPSPSTGSPATAPQPPITTPTAPTTAPVTTSPTTTAPVTTSPTTTAPTAPPSPPLAPPGSPSPMLVKNGPSVVPATPPGPAVTVSMPQLPNTYDVNSYASTSYSTEVAALTQPSVFFVDPLGHLGLDTDVVTRVKLRTSPQVVEYTINPKATWSDGVPVSCQDFYLAWLASTSHAPSTNPDYPGAFATFNNPDYENAHAPRCSDGGRTVTVAFTRPFPGWQTLFEGLLPAHVAARDAGISDITSIKATDKSGPVLKLAQAYHDDFSSLKPAKNPSAGPYVITAASGSEVELARNPQWWGNPAGPSGVRLVRSSGDAAAITSIRNREADVTSIIDQNVGVTGDLRAMAGITRTNQILPVADHIDFSMRDAPFTGKTGNALRRAMFSCVDRTAIVKAVVSRLDPTAKPLGNMLVQQWDPAYADHYAGERTADVAKAKKVMQQGGWTLGKDGIFAHGTAKAQFILTVLANPTRQAVAKLVQQQCRKAGIDIKVATVDITKIVTGKLPATLFGWSAPVSADAFAPTYRTGGASNYNGYSNKKVDALFDDIAADVAPTSQSARLNQIDKIMAADQVTMPLYDETAVNLQVDRIHTTVTNDYFWGGVVWDVFAWSVAE